MYKCIMRLGPAFVVANNATAPQAYKALDHSQSHSRQRRSGFFYDEQQRRHFRRLLRAGRARRVEDHQRELCGRDMRSDKGKVQYALRVVE